MQEQIEFASAVLSALLSGEGALRYVRVAAYFGAFLLSLGAVLRSFPWRRTLRSYPALLLVYPYSLAALYYTWRLILTFFVEQNAAFAAHPDPPNLFIEAYVLVCDSAAGWWWSSQLLCFVTVACPVAFGEAARRGMSPRLALAYMVTAFLGAVSLAFPFLFAHLLLLPTLPLAKRRASAAPGWLWPLCVVAALVSIPLLPAALLSSHRPVFIVALAVVHGVLLVPFAHSALVGSGRPDSNPAAAPARAGRTAYLALAACVTALHLYATYNAIAQLRPNPTRRGGPPPPLMAAWAVVRGLAAAFWRNVCQTSISIDVVLSTGALLSYLLRGSEPTERSYVRRCCAITPLVGPAAVLALVAARRAGKEAQERVPAPPRKASRLTE